LKQDTRDQESAQMRGLTLFRLGKPSDAIPLLEGAKEWTSQTKVDPSYVLALCYLDTRNYDKARAAFATQYGFPPDSPAAYLLAARMLLRREYVPIAQEFASKALELDPQQPSAANCNVAVGWLAQGSTATMVAGNSNVGVAVWSGSSVGPTATLRLEPLAGL